MRREDRVEWIEVVYKDGILTQVRYPNTGPPGMSLKIIDPVLERAAIQVYNDRDR